MTPETRATLETYAKRMDRKYSDVLREFRGFSRTQQGQLLSEMRTVEAAFLEHTAELAAEARKRWRWARRIGRVLGSLLAMARRR